MAPNDPPAEPLPRSIIMANTLMFAIAFAMWVMFGPSVRIIAEQFGLSATEASLIKAVPILTGSILRIPIGILTDRIGARLIFPILLWLGAAATVGMTFAGSMTAFIVGGLVMGMVGTTFVVGVQSVSSWTPRSRQGFALGIFGAGNVGTAVTTLGMPILLVAAGWKVTFYVYAGVIAMAGVAYWLWVEDVKTDRPKPTLKALLAPAKSGKAWLFGLYYSATFGVFVATTLTLSDVYIDGYGMSMQWAGALATVFTFTASMSRMPGGALADRIGARRALLISLPTICLCLAPIAVGPPLWLTVVLVFIAGIAMGVGMAATFKEIPTHFPDAVGAVGGLVGAIGGLGGFYLPLAGGWFGASTGSVYAQIIPTAAVAALAVFAALLAGPQREQRSFNAAAVRS